MFIHMVIRKKENKNNQIDIIELHNVVKFENWLYKIENKEFELLNINILKIWNLKSLCEMSRRNMKIWKFKCLNNENKKLNCLKIGN